MPIPNWPSTLPAPSVDMPEELYLPAERDEFENGDVNSRKRFSRARGRFQLAWTVLTEAEYQTLRTFFLANQGGTFTWTHPVDSVAYTCTFSADTLSSKNLGAGLRSVELPIQED